MGFLHGYLEVLEVDFPQGPFTYDGVILVAVGLLVVEGIMLYRSSDSVRLHTSYIGCGHLPGKQRILREILVVTSVEGIAVNVLSRSQEHVHAVFKYFIAERRRHLFDKGSVP